MTTPPDTQDDELLAVAELWDRAEDDLQPWMPPGMWAPKVGDRVQVLSRPECRYCGNDGMKENGATGVVVETQHTNLYDRDPSYLSHHYWVSLDDKTIIEGLEQHFAASELLPLPADDGGR